MEHYDNSKQGNDCYLSEHWYLVDEPQECAVKISKESGFYDKGLDHCVYTEIDSCMPDDVKRWFGWEG